LGISSADLVSLLKFISSENTPIGVFTGLHRQVGQVFFCDANCHTKLSQPQRIRRYLSEKLMATPPDNAVKTLDDLLHQALVQGASDVHFESGEDFFRTRFRIDGLLRVAATPALTLRDAIVSRIKVLARMDIAEKRLPQDGRIQYPLP
jgi:type II secretory ATPase GspE/PulE/Tfp pilus assembly ATPase PilB-like protein